ncbi:pentatricopeptide repeat-containing protein At2g33680-like [Carica papaya]|uniref:pentatricopeptide repeat-containing protein At2g33680-like n=1 Tax=Carica papaya TaxID=3649 RepID=UPI000B8CC576|nr:pentatricopeptide repeat-containing protein At2g33680-like [Carica papaya]
MLTLFPATLPCPCNPRKFSISQKTKHFHGNNFTSCFILTCNPRSSTTRTTQSCSIPTGSCAEQTPISDNWSQLLKSSIGCGDFQLGQAIHGFLVKSGFQKDDPFQGNNLVNFYAKFDRLDDAERVFDEMPIRNTITWTSLINGYLQSGDLKSVLLVARDMYRSEEKLNEHTCSVILRACSLLEDRAQGEQIHGFAIKNGLYDNVVLGTSLIAMYKQTGVFDEAEKVFNDIANKDVQCLNYMILEYGKAGYGKKAIQVFDYMVTVGFEPSDYTFSNIISAGTENVGIEVGRQLHGLAAKYGFLGEISVGNAVIAMYGKNGMVEEAETMFDAMNDRNNLISWTALMSVYVKNGLSEKAIDRFLLLLNLEFLFDSSCLATVLDACSECNNFELGYQVHGFVIKHGLTWDIILGTALVDLYAKCGNLQSARIVFNSFSPENVTLFNAILVVLTEMDGNGEEDVLVLFNKLRLAGIQPDNVTFSRLLSLSAKQACLVKGKSIHGYTIKTGFGADLTVGNALVTMYAKCGSIGDAYKMFNGMKNHDFVSWNAMISAYALHGQGEKAILVFQEIERLGFAPDEITVLAVLQACNYSGLWKHGLHLFSDMESKYGITPVIEHFACMVELLGRAGQLSEAVDFIYKSPFPDSPLLWRTLVNVCKLHGDLNFGMVASKHLLELAPNEAASYILVSNMYAGEGMLDEAAKFRTTMDDLKLSKEAGCSWLEIDNKVHHFMASSRSHPESGEIYAKLDLLKHEMELGYDSKFDLYLT